MKSEQSIEAILLRAKEVAQLLGISRAKAYRLVPAGGIAPDGSRWIPCRPKFFLPAKVLSKMFRGKFLALLREVFADGKLEFHGQLRPLRQSNRFHNLLRELKSIKWVVHAKPPLGGPGHLLQYLARYTHRVAISNGR